MKGNPQNIEVGDVVRFEAPATSERITSVVSSIWEQGYTHLVDEEAIDGYLVRASIMSKGSVCNYPVKSLTIIRKWDGSVPSKYAKQSKRGQEVTYSCMRTTDKSLETLVLAVELIEGLTSSDIVEIDRVNRIIEVSRNMIDKLCEFVNTKTRIFHPDCDRNVEFNGCDFWINNERLTSQYFLDDVVEPIIVEELKRRALAKKSN